MMVDTNNPVSHFHLVAVNYISGVDPWVSMRDFMFPKTAIYIALSPLNTQLSPNIHANAMALLKEYATIFYWSSWF